MQRYRISNKCTVGSSSSSCLNSYFSQQSSGKIAKSYIGIAFHSVILIIPYKRKELMRYVTHFATVVQDGQYLQQLPFKSIALFFKTLVANFPFLFKLL